MAKDTTLQIVVDDGSKKVPILNTFGDEIGMFYFRPTDLGIIERYNAVAADFDKIVEPLQAVNITKEGKAEDGDDEGFKALKEAEKLLFEACDQIFGDGMSAAFFGSMNPFSPVGGVFYCEKVLDQLGSFLSAQFLAETEKINKRVNKYVGKYGKKK